MMLSNSPFEPTTNDFRLVEEAIRRTSKSTPFAEHQEEKLRNTLFGELSRGKRDMFSLIRAARKAVEFR